MTRQARIRTLFGGLVLAAAVIGQAPTTHAAEPFTVDDSVRALEGAPYIVRCIAERETGYTLDPYSLGAAGEQGIAQLLPTGPGASPWNAFWYGDWSPLDPSLRSPWNPFQSAAFLEQYGAEHGYSAWTTARYC